jgi:hypothetical protein
MKKKRSRRNRERFWRETLSRQAKSGQSVRAFCQERRLTESAFYFWQRELNQHNQEQPAAGTATLPRRDAMQPPARIEGETTEPNQEPRGLVPARPAPVVPGETDATPPAPAIKERLVKTTVSAIGREERFRLTDPMAISVEIETDSHGESTKLDAELVDISQGGVRLRSKTSVAVKDALTITIVPKGFSKSLSARAQVCWTLLAPKGRYWLGCSIEPRIPLALLDHLAVNGILERRHDLRQEVSIILSACWELDPTAFDVSVLNISWGGICLWIPQGGNPGDRICLTLPGDNQKPTYILMAVCWQVDADDGYVVGCSFCHHASYEKLMQFADARYAKAMGRSPALSGCSGG